MSKFFCNFAADFDTNIETIIRVTSKARHPEFVLNTLRAVANLGRNRSIFGHSSRPKGQSEGCPFWKTDIDLLTKRA